MKLRWVLNMSAMILIAGIATSCQDVTTSNSDIVPADSVQNVDTNIKDPQPRECLSKYRSCDYANAVQATYNVNPEGDWEFKMFYGSGKENCYRYGTGESTEPGAVQHEEWKMSNDGDCLVLINRIYFK